MLLLLLPLLLLAFQISQIPMRRQDKVFKMHWTTNESIVVVYETAFVELYVSLPLSLSRHCAQAYVRLSIALVLTRHRSRFMGTGTR